MFSAVSCVKRDRDLGRKFESGASNCERKRKAVLERKSVELNGPFLQFLKRNCDASVSNRDLGEKESEETAGAKCDSFDDQIVREKMANAETTYFNGRASVT